MQHHFNGSTATILYKLGRLEVKAENTERAVMRIEADTRRSTRRLDLLERQASTTDRLKDLSGWLTGAIILVLALAGRWSELGAFLGASGK